MTIKTIKTQQKYVLNKPKRLELKQSSNKSLSTLRMTQNSTMLPSPFSFDAFFYRDHVTLKQYSFENLKKAKLSKKRSSQKSLDQRLRKTQQMQVMHLIQYIDLWKSIKANRNDILVYGNKKNMKDQSNISSRQPIFKKQNQECQTKRKTFKQIPKRTAELIDQNQSLINNYINSIQLNKINPHKISKSQRPSELPNSEGLLKLKQKMNNQLYKMNKEIFRDYLKENNSYDFSEVNFLIKNQDNLDSKLKKIQRLIKVLQIKNKSQNKQNFQENKILKCNQHSSSKILQPSLNQLNFQINKKGKELFSLQKTSEIQNTDNQNANGQDNKPLNQDDKNHANSEIKAAIIKYSKQKKNHIIQNKANFKVQQMQGQNRLNILPKFQKQKRKFYLRTQGNQQKIDQLFQGQWFKLQKQIKIKYRRQAEFSINKFKKQKKPIIN